MGGQLPASLIYTVETRPKERWGLYGSLVMMAANVGTLLGNFVGAILRSTLTEEQLVNWVSFYNVSIWHVVYIFHFLYNFSSNNDETTIL